MFKPRIRGEGWFAIPQYSMSSSICIPNMTLLACKVVEKSLTKKCYGITEGRRTDGMTDRCKPVYPPTFSKRGYKYSEKKKKNSSVSISTVYKLAEKVRALTELPGL